MGNNEPRLRTPDFSRVVNLGFGPESGERKGKNWWRQARQSRTNQGVLRIGYATSFLGWQATKLCGAGKAPLGRRTYIAADRRTSRNLSFGGTATSEAALIFIGSLSGSHI